MKTKIVYVLTSTEQDLFLEQTLLSVYSLRLYNADADVLLVVDDYTDKTLVGQRRDILKYVSRKIVVNIPSIYNQKQRSRFLKTSLRDIVQGDFLFIDSDTIITDSLADIDGTDFIIGAVADLHKGKVPVRFKQYRSYLKEMGWEVPTLTYFNSGIIYCKDVSEAYTFYHNWHKLWVNFVKHGYSVDQPSMAEANMTVGGKIGELDAIWNCQSESSKSVGYIYKAKIIHYFGDAFAKSYYQFLNKSILEEYKKTGVFSSETIYLLKNARVMLSVPYTIYGKHLLDVPNTFIFRVINKLYSIIFRHNYL